MPSLLAHNMTVLPNMTPVPEQLQANRNSESQTDTVLLNKPSHHDPASYNARRRPVLTGMSAGMLDNCGQPLGEPEVTSHCRITARSLTP